VKGVQLGEERLNNLFKNLLEEGIVDVMVIPQKIGGNVAYTMISDPEKLRSPAIFTPIFTVNAANVLKHMPAEKKIGVVFKPCETKAAIELVKLEQFEKDSVLMITVGCEGAYKLDDYNKHSEEIGDTLETSKIEELEAAGCEIRPACRICEDKLLGTGDVLIDRTDGNILVAAISDMGEESLRAVGDLELTEIDTGVLERKRSAIVESAKPFREEWAKTSEELRDLDKFLDVFKDCIVCKNCRDMCPVCYCKTCFFEQPLGKPEGVDLLNIVGLRGSIKVPTDSLLFQLTRMYHDCLTCVECGACADACPREIPLTNIFPWISEKVKELFEYKSGRDVEETLPLLTYQEDELQPRE